MTVHYTYISPSLNGSSVIWHFKHDDAIKIRHRITRISIATYLLSSHFILFTQSEYFSAINSDSYDCPLYVCCACTCTCVVAPLSLQMATNSQECYASQQFLIVDMLFHACFPENKTLWLAKCPRCQRKMITGHTQGKQQCSLTSFSA